MDAVKKELLEQKGFDVDGTMRRFLNNEALYMKCMKKFLDDTSFEKLKESYQAGNVNEAFKAAHTMKGSVSNLGIAQMYQMLIPMVEKLRVQDMNIEDDMKNLEILYQEIYQIIDEL